MNKIANYGTPLAVEKRPNILDTISPANKKLSQLDAWEREALYQLSKKILSIEKFEETINTINLARKKALIALDKEQGLYKSEAQKVRERKELQKEIDERYELEQLQQQIDKARAKQRNNRILEVFTILLLVVGLFLAAHSAAISILLLLFVYFKYFNKSTKKGR